MTTLESYRREMREMFFISVKNEIDVWTNNTDKKDLYSPRYDGNIHLNLDMNKENLLLVKNKSDGKQDVSFICRYKWWIIPLDYEVWKYSLILRKHFKKKAEDEIAKKDIMFLSSTLDIIKEKHFIAIRKEKLEQLENK